MHLPVARVLSRMIRRSSYIPILLVNLSLTLTSLPFLSSHLSPHFSSSLPLFISENNLLPSITVTRVPFLSHLFIPQQKVIFTDTWVQTLLFFFTHQPKPRRMHLALSHHQNPTHRKTPGAYFVLVSQYPDLLNVGELSPRTGKVSIPLPISIFKANQSLSHVRPVMTTISRCVLGITS